MLNRTPGQTYRSHVCQLLTPANLAIAQAAMPQAPKDTKEMKWLRNYLVIISMGY